MLIDISKYVNIVMDKLGKVGFYSEVDEEQLVSAITKQLSKIYNEKIEVLSLQFDIDRHRGLPIDNGRYKEEYAKIRREILIEAYEISMSSQANIPPALP